MIFKKKKLYDLKVAEILTKIRKEKSKELKNFEFDYAKRGITSGGVYYQGWNKIQIKYLTKEAKEISEAYIRTLHKGKIKRKRQKNKLLKKIEEICKVQKQSYLRTLDDFCRKKGNKELKNHMKKIFNIEIKKTISALKRKIEINYFDDNKKETNWTLIGALVAIITLILSIIINWNKIFDFFKKLLR